MQTQIAPRQSQWISNRIPNTMWRRMLVQPEQLEKLWCTLGARVGWWIHRANKCEAKPNIDDSLPMVPFWIQLKSMLPCTAFYTTNVVQNSFLYKNQMQKNLIIQIIAARRTRCSRFNCDKSMNSRSQSKAKSYKKQKQKRTPKCATSSSSIHWFFLLFWSFKYIFPYHMHIDVHDK